MAAHRKDEGRPHLEALKRGGWITSECDESISHGLRAFASELTTAHTLTSRRYSIWSLLGRHVDRPWQEYVATLDSACGTNLLDGFLPSTCWKSSPRVRPIETAKARRRSGGDDVGTQLAQWGQQFAAAMRRACHGSGAVSFGDEGWKGADAEARGLDTFLGTADSFVALLAELPHLRTKYPEEGEVDALFPRQFCRLCWRETVNASLSRQGVEATSNSKQLSNKYCHVHQPGVSGSRYAKDRRYASNFKHELNALFWKERSAHAFRFPLPSSACQQELRKTAYDLVHSGLRSPDLPLGKLSHRELVLSMHAKGLRQVEIAGALGVSRQAVSKTLKKIVSAIGARTSEECLDPRTGEIVGADGFVAQALQLRRKGLSDREIADRLGLFKHTIQVMLASD